ncbi:MAG: hypothetical protein WCO56_09695 [Verrucomicrobiota bacterium]
MLVYAICLVVGLLFTVFSAVFGHFFGGHDGDASGVGTGGHAEAGYDHSGIPGISFFSPTVLAAFVTAFGGLGIVFTSMEATQSPWVSAPLAGLGAGGIATLVMWLFNSVLQKVQGSSESHVNRLAGCEASVISPIPANGTGEIAYVQGGSRYNAPARTEDGTAISGGQTVTITRVVGTQFFVAVKH